MAEPSYDVFISYSHEDKEWVRGKLLPYLERAQLKVFIDIRDSRIGAAFVQEMERAVSESRKTLLVLTPAYLASTWGVFEDVLLQTLKPVNEEPRLIPILKVPCDLPMRFRAVTYVDFTAGEDMAWERLLDAIDAPVKPSRTEQVMGRKFGEFLRSRILRRPSPSHSAIARDHVSRREAEALWRKHLGPLLDAERTRAVLGLESERAVAELALQGRILELSASGGRTLYPAFQFASEGHPYPEVAEVINTFAEVVQTPYTIASWFVSPNPLLEQQTPVAWMQARRDPALLREAARRSAGRLAH